MKWVFLSLILSIACIGTIDSINAENVPDWVKNTAGWWATDVISEKEFVNAIEYLVTEQIIHVATTQTSENAENVPDWVIGGSYVTIIAL